MRGSISLCGSSSRPKCLQIPQNLVRMSPRDPVDRSEDEFAVGKSEIVAFWAFSVKACNINNVLCLHVSIMTSVVVMLLTEGAELHRI